MHCKITILAALISFKAVCTNAVYTCHDDICADVEVPPVELPELPNYNPPDLSVLRSTDLQKRGANSSVPLNLTHVVTDLYRHEFENGTSLYSPYDLDDLAEQGVVSVTVGTKRGVEYIAYGVAVYATTYGVLRATATATNNGVLRSVANMFGDIGI
jgi:hypothetical protein